MRSFGRFRAALHSELSLDSGVRDKLTAANKIVMVLVIASIACAIAQSEEPLRATFPNFFIAANTFFAIAFSIEYLLRSLASPRSSPEASEQRPTSCFALTWPGLLDLLVVVSLWVDVFTQVAGVYGVLLRVMRVLRIITLSKNSRLSIASGMLLEATIARRTELALSFLIAVVVLLIAATLLYLAEGSAQPVGFGSIPRAMWWSLATLTTVGYGDVYPITPLGKILAGVTAVFAIAVVALPTGIMAAAFSEVFQKLRKASD